MRIALCDDEKEQRDKYGDLLNGFAEKNRLPIELDYYESGEQLLFHLEDADCIPDIVFLDVHMPVLDGIETARRLRQRAYSGELVFLTVSGDHMPEAFDVNAFHYIVKDVTPAAKIEEILTKAVRAAEEKQEEYLLLSSVGEYRNIPIHKIAYFEVMQRVITVYYDGGKQFEFVSTIGKLEASLYGKGFLRTSRSFLVSASHIASFSYEAVVMTNGAQLPVGRKYYKLLKEKMTARADA